ncbi:hypothetical protein KY347_05450 [Candidatus Woesearchaeota archaeon]|nr:hypothetical protein [Candidatus Woesearchaeota archaeon]
MALFGFGKKKQEERIFAAPGVPLDQIKVMKQRGMGDDQIVSELEKQGYNSSQIFDALNQINLAGPGFGNPPNSQIPVSDFPPVQQFQQQPPPQQPPVFQDMEPPVAPQGIINKDQIEEMTEAIIDEKWKEFENDLKVIIDWKEKKEAKIAQLEQQVKDLTENLSTLNKSLGGKISEYDKNITDVGTEIKAMEKVFQKVLPSLTESINKLERITKSSKLAKK